MNLLIVASRLIRLSVVPFWCGFLMFLAGTIVLISTIPLFIKSGLHGFFTKQAGGQRPRTSAASPTTPIIAFTGGGAALPYYTGILGFLQDHFDLSQTRCSGVSIGCVVASLMFFDVPATEALEMSLGMNEYFGRRWLYCLLLSSEGLRTFVKGVLAKMGVTKRLLKQTQKRKGDHLYIASTTLHPSWPFGRTALYSSFSDMEDLAFACTSSMHTVPFLRDLERYRGLFCVDGAFSCMYAVPDDDGDSPVVRIACFPLPERMADVCPEKFLSVRSYFFSGNLERQTDLFLDGYRDAARNMEVFLKKGLSPLDARCDVSGAKWKARVEARVGVLKEQILLRYRGEYL